MESVVLAELDKLYRVATRMVSEPTKAEDLVGLTLFTAFKNADHCDGRFPTAWLIKIMRHHWLHEMRKVSESTDASELIETQIDAHAHHKFLAAIQSLDILRALDKLPTEYRMAIVLCDMEELDYAEAATALSVPVGTIRSRLSRGRTLLQQQLASWVTNK